MVIFSTHVGVSLSEVATGFVFRYIPHARGGESIGNLYGTHNFIFGKERRLFPPFKKSGFPSPRLLMNVSFQNNLHGYNDIPNLVISIPELLKAKNHKKDEQAFEELQSFQRSIQIYTSF